MTPQVGHRFLDLVLLGGSFVLALALASCDDDATAPAFVPVIAGSAWTIAYSPSMPTTLNRNGDDYYFDFPNSSDGIDYVIKRAPPMKSGQNITMVFALEGAGTLLPSEGSSPAKVRLFMQRTGDTLTAQEPHKRWWSKAFILLESPQQFVLSTRIEPDEWFSVFGANGSTAPEAFIDCVTHLAHVGFTFGGDFAGHGVYVKNGSVRFILKRFSVS